MRQSGALPRGAGRERAELVVRLDPPGGALQGEAERAFFRRVRAAFGEVGIRMSDRWWAEVPLDDGRELGPLVERLEDLAREGAARPGSGHLSLWLEDDAAAPLEWFELDPTQVFHLRRSAPYPDLSAGDMPPGGHVAQGGSHYVSESFKAAVEEEGLTGLEFLWVRDVGRYKAPQWYAALPVFAVGRGVDHPWFDREAYEAWWVADGDILRTLDHLVATSPARERARLVARREAWRRRQREAVAPGARRFGARQFDTRFIREGCGFTDPIRDRLMRLFDFQDRLNCLTLLTPLIVLRRFLPESDFAFSWGYWEASTRDDEVAPFGRVCLNRRARDVLLRRRLVRPAELRGVLVLDEPPPGSPVFDDPEHTPPREFTPEELQQARVDEARLWQAFLRRSRKDRSVTLDAALKRLRAARRAQPESFAKPARERDLDAVEADLGRALPAAWRALLRIADGFEPDSADEPCLVQGTSGLAAFHRETLEWVEHTAGRPESRFLYVGSWQAGDVLALEVAGGERRESCPVVRVDHEELSEGRRWPGVAEFLDELLAST